MSLPMVSGMFGVVDAPDIRFGDDGSAWVKLRGVAKDRRYNKETSAWEDGDPTYIDIIVNGKNAENLAESVTTGDAIVVTGKLVQREWTNKEGQKQKAYSIRAVDVGVSTQFTPAKTPKFLAGMAHTPSGQESQDGAPF